MYGYSVFRNAFFLLLIVFGFTEFAASQDYNPGHISGASVPDVPDTLSGWEVNWPTSLNISQAAYSNWSKGGVNTLSVNSSSSFRVMHQKDHFIYDFEVRARFGQAMIEDKGLRKTDDRFFVRNRFLYDLYREEDFKLFGNIDMDTQLARGFEYSSEKDVEDVLISNFFAPVYFRQNSGIAYMPGENFYLEFGLGLQQTYINNIDLSPRYGLEEGQYFRSEAGTTFGLNIRHEIMEDVIYLGSLETFTNMNNNLRDSNVSFFNKIEGEVNDYIRLHFQLDMIYDPDFSRKVQRGQLLSAGFAFNII